MAMRIVVIALIDIQVAEAAVVIGLEAWRVTVTAGYKGHSVPVVAAVVVAVAVMVTITVTVTAGYKGHLVVIVGTAMATEPNVIWDRTVAHMTMMLMADLVGSTPRVIMRK